MFNKAQIQTFSVVNEGSMVMKVRNCQKGFLLIEILLGLALIGIIAAGLLNGLSTGFRGVVVSQERVAAESLAKSQIEYIKTQDYIAVVDYNELTNCYELIDILPQLAAAGYTVEINPPEHILTGTFGFELQSVTVAVTRSGQGKISISFYRVSA